MGTSKVDNDRFKGKRLLVVDDMEVNRKMLLILLKDSGLIIDCARNGKEAIDIITANHEEYDMVFMDIKMPQMGRMEAARLIRALPPRSRGKLPIVAMVANFRDDIDAYIAAGMDDHIRKPFGSDKLLEILHKFLNND
ncbi:MAG: response regulator [Defluviitaleaceae bacterium]|nr:response regulator [Defluviitaleaceae bacterium]